MPRQHAPSPEGIACGHRLRAAREARGLSRTEVATLVDATFTEVWRWETGRALPARPMRQRLAHVLHVPQADVFAGLEPKTPHRPYTKLTVPQVARIKRDLIDDTARDTLAQRYEVDVSTIGLIARGVTWTAVCPAPAGPACRLADERERDEQ